MKCFCKLPGKHHHELWYTLSGFHIVRLPLDSQLGLYILSWKQFWISYFLFSSDFPYASLHFFFFAYYFSLNAFALAVWCIPIFLSFVCACMCAFDSPVAGHPLCMPCAITPSSSQQVHVYLSGPPPNTDPDKSKTPSPSETEAKKDTKKESKKRKDFKPQANSEPKR